MKMDIAKKSVAFDWLEYTVFGVMLGLSALIGAYFGFAKGGQRSVDTYLLGGRDMGVLPISVSLVCSFTSGIMLLGIPTEIYVYGTQHMAAVFSFIITGLVTAFVLIPIFYNLQSISLYQYLEKRFNSKVRKLASIIFALNMLLNTPIVIYGPALALNQVAGLNVHTVTAVVSVICIFYTTIGGLKAVVWSDTLQGMVMILAMTLTAALGTHRVGGLQQVLRAAQGSGRLELFLMNIDPRIRNTFWSVTIGMTFVFIGTTSINASFTQRYIALPTMRKAQWSVLYFVVGSCAFFLISGYMGLVIYAKYKGCDPLSSGKIDMSDQILPFFIVDSLGDFRGLPGIFLAGIVCAALSTMSTNLNTVAGTIYSDFLEPYLPKVYQTRASSIVKVIALIFGVLCLALVFVIQHLGAIIELTLAFFGVSTGAMLGIFTLGIFFPRANSIGATVGATISLAVMGWILVGSRTALLSGKIVYQTKPISTQQCLLNITTDSVSRTESEEVFALLEVSVFYHSLLGCLIAVTTGLLASYLSPRQGRLDKKLLSPLVHRFLPRYQLVAPPATPV